MPLMGLEHHPALGRVVRDAERPLAAGRIQAEMAAELDIELWRSACFGICAGDR